MNAYPGLTTVQKDSTLDQPTIITVTINATSLQQNPSASLTQLNSSHTTHLSRQHCRQTKSRWFSEISSTSSETQVHQHRSQTMVLNCINVSEASTSTWPLHPKTQHPQNDTVTLPNTTCLTIHHPATTKGVAPNSSKGGHPTSKHSYFSYWYNHPKTFCRQMVP